MKKRIRSIFLLMTLCILGINLFQGYWLYTTYQLNIQQFSRTVRDALFDALQKRQLADAQQLFRTKAPNGKAPQRVIYRRFESETGDPDRILVSESRDTVRMRLEEDRSNVMVYSFRRKPGEKAEETLPADTLARKISKMLIYNWAENRPFNMAKMDSTYRAELRLREVDADFLLDTLHIAAQPGPAQRVRFTGQAREGFAINTPPVPVNPVQGQFLQAWFKTPTSYILRKMGWLLGSSVLLLVLTTGCFLFMLSTIIRQKKLSEIKNDFINNMTHELKTPIATVSAAVEAMQHFGALNDPQRTEKYLTISRNELQRLSDLVEKVLNMAVEEKKDMVLNPEWIKPSELINPIISNYQLKATKAIQFEVDMQPDEEPVRLDRFHLTNAINNLIDNAIKYSGESVTIRISSGKQDKIWRLLIKDNGIGIPRAYQEAIFDRFFRVPTGNLHPVKGFGLGLSYVRQVVEKHGGQVEVVSEPGMGSEFILLIPELGGDGVVGIKKFRVNLNPLHSSSI
ncbi:HAMP domain-containing sensor histidine kinase [Nibrella saemangeumensis]|uniref:histidine kinase n=1 Tax=Nibrella saemangeumensis TaxID=1084526 RepID=A0ABP8MT44_9BACT